MDKKTDISWETGKAVGSYILDIEMLMLRSALFKSAPALPQALAIGLTLVVLVISPPISSPAMILLGTPWPMAILLLSSHSSCEPLWIWGKGITIWCWHSSERTSLCWKYSASHAKTRFFLKSVSLWNRLKDGFPYSTLIPALLNFYVLCMLLVGTFCAKEQQKFSEKIKASLSDCHLAVKEIMEWHHGLAQCFFF